MSKRTDYWKAVSDVLMKMADRKAPTNADSSLTLSMAYRALSLSECADGGPTHLTQPAENVGDA